MITLTLTVDDKEEVFEGETVEEAQDKRNKRLAELSAEFKAKHSDDTESPAKGRKGFILYNPFDEKHFFRIYDPENKRKFTDYEVCEEVEVQVLGDLSLFEQIIPGGMARP